MTAMDRRSLISKSVVMIRIGVHPTGEEPDQHAVCVTSGLSRTTTIHKSLLNRNRVSAPGMKYWLPAMPGLAVMLGCLILPLTTTLKQGGMVRQSSYKSY
jgi:hypothetical protein